MSTPDLDHEIRDLRFEIGNCSFQLRHLLQNNLALKLGERYSLTREVQDNIDAIDVAREAVGATPETDVHRHIVLHTLSIQLGDQFARSHAIDDGNQAIRMARDSVRVAMESGQDYIPMAYNLGVQLSEMYDCSGNLDGLQESISLAHEVIQATPTGSPEWPSRQNGLAVRLGKRYSATGTTEDLDQAIEAAQKLVDVTPESDPAWASRQTNLLTQLGHRFSQTGNMQYLEKAIVGLQNINRSISENHQDWVLCLRSLGNRLYERYMVIGKMDDLDEAIRVAKEAVRSVPEGHGELITLWSNLGMHLGNRYSRTGLMEDLEDAISLIRQAIGAIEADFQDRRHPNWGPLQNNLGLLLGKKYARTKAKDVLDEAIDAARQAVAGVDEGHVNRPLLLNNLSLRLGERSLAEESSQDLDEAIELSRQAVEAAGNHPVRGGLLGNLSDWLEVKASRTQMLDDREEAIRMSRDAIDAVSPVDPSRAALLKGLGDKLRNRYAQDKAPQTFSEANQCFQAALDHERSPTSHRIAAGRQLLLSAAMNDDPSIDVDAAAEKTINLIPFCAPMSLRIRDKHFLLSQVVGLASDAAAVALAVGKGCVEAIARLEGGRGVLAGALQDLRTDVCLLKEKHPELARSFIDVRDMLDQPPGDDLLPPAATEDSSTTSLITPDKRHQASEEMPRLLAAIRSKPGFERFLLPLSRTEIQEAAVQGPVVIINVSLFRCDALVIQSSGIKAIRLNPLTQQDVLDQGSRVQSVETLSWLWDSIVRPVFEAVGFNTLPSEQSWPRIWWIPTGPLVGFPLHAAGLHLQSGSKSALDRAISSYSPTVKTIVHSRKQPIERLPTKESGQALLVGMSHTPSQRSLPYVTAEIEVVHRICQDTGLFPVQPRPFGDDVLSAMKQCTVFHFAGHGDSLVQEPLQSHLLLMDWEKRPLTVERMMGTKLGSRASFLAYLSACRTGQIKDKESVDESIHLMAAFQLAGFRHVVGTFWEVDDEQCVSIAALTYEALQKDGISDVSVSRGLHFALRKVRDDWARSVGADGQKGSKDLEKGRDIEPESRDGRMPAWVPYAHYGI